MSEKRFFNFIFIEGLLLLVLGLCVLILPKLTSVTFGVMLSAAFITYGIYKAVVSIINKNYVSNMLFSIFLGIFILTIGVLLLLVPRVSLLWLIALIGVFFLLETVSSVAFVSKMRNMFNSIACKGFAAFVLFIVGLSIILGLPVMSFWMVAMLSGIAFVVKGMAKITLALVNRNNYNV